MIYTVTFNPSLDYIVSVEHFQPGKVNRTTEEIIYAGGKGINVSMVLKNLGYKSTATGFLAGFTGIELKNRMKEQGVCEEFIDVGKGFSRINIKLRSDEESEINGMGPVIGNEEMEKLYRKLDKLTDGDILVLAGSIPSTMPETIYMDIMKYLSGRKLKIVVDATKDLLKNVLTFRPFLVKPNNHELGEMFGVELSEKEEVIVYAKKLQQMGAVNVLVSMAGEGAVLVDETGTVYESMAPKGTVVNSVGAGDSMVAGFIAGYLSTGSYEEAFKTGVCSGSASAFSKQLATKQEVDDLRKQCEEAGIFHEMEVFI
ncbi:MAG: 1-phosphofructokinase [Lachnospiraceae bacterium]|nr:1-phosphofructokinase [Lachnospiraceae bacterium]